MSATEFKATLKASEIDAAKQLLTAEGYVVVKAKSYQQVLRDRDVALARLDYAQNETEGVKRWAQQAWDEERFLRNRLTFVYGVACSKGATTEELRGDDEQANTILRWSNGRPPHRTLADIDAEATS